MAPFSQKGEGNDGGNGVRHLSGFILGLKGSGCKASRTCLVRNYGAGQWEMGKWGQEPFSSGLFGSIELKGSLKGSGTFELCFLY